MSGLWQSLDEIQEAFEDATFYSAFEEALQAPAISDELLFAGIHTFYDHYEHNGIRTTRDTDVLVSFYDDIDDVFGEGIIQSWQHNVCITDAYEAKETGESVERAYILSEDGKTSNYARFNHIRVICEVNKNDTYTSWHVGLLPPLPDPATTENTETSSERRNSDLWQPIVPAANYDIVEAI